MTSPVSPPPPAGGGGKGRSSAVRIALIGAIVVGVGVGAFVIGRKSSGGGGSGPAFSSGAPKGPPTAGATVEGMPEVSSEPTKMEVPGAAALPAIWVDVHSPAKVRDALARNAWLKAQWEKPLGQGFASGWAAFLGSTGTDLKASFKGAVLDVVVGQLLDTPFRTVWFSGDARVGTPAILVPKANKTAQAAWDSLDAVAKRGEMVADSCPAGMEKAPDGGFHLSRWLVAEQTVWAARAADRLVLSRHPVVVLQALCTALPELEADDGADVEVGFDANAYGREAQLFTHVLGLGEDTRLQLRVDGDRLVAKGIAGKVGGKSVSVGKPLSDDLLKLVPEDTPVLFAFQLTLPESLEPAQLKAFWKDEGRAPMRTRQVALTWTPRGSTSMEPELALLWGDEKDAEGLSALFSGGARTLVSTTLCKHVVLATSQQEVERLKKACEGRAPNMLNAAGPVVAGLRAPSTVVLGVNMGRLLSGLAMDGYTSEARVDRSSPMPKALPPEIEAARRDLEALPYLGFRGNAQGYVMASEGFGT
ncbi:hypothetical protein COCOR_00510 [Corallococcus coralloides DSM 2259]|uniref:Uncharacterized protein n=1 Tax=Corallococcus coralloides (strain ATCC 25202 / DSM 2259 / NBRC 100086 / M2) TaxID=1144275 RepID=H8N1B7_CORCM|nr:hypothetical protein [Corallococcus coralloides]AFE03533.1 hypothetical protein COCOR_00510 [Corallococcus coralloides DSM 2259]